MSKPTKRQYEWAEANGVKYRLGDMNSLGWCPVECFYRRRWRLLHAAITPYVAEAVRQRIERERKTGFKLARPGNKKRVR